MNNQPTTPSLGDVVDLARQLALDAEVSGASLRHRDRAIGRELTALQRRPVTQLLAWLQRVREERGDRLGERLTALQRLGLALLGVAGLAAGWGAAAVVFHYDGTHPVNVIHVLAVFVLLPLVLLLGFGLGLVPASVVRRIPGLGAVQDAMGLLNPGRLQRLLARYLPQQQREFLTSLLGRGESHRRLFGRVDRWVVVRASQIFALSFYTGATASAVYLVIFSDLAFAWSTTLAATAADLQRWTDLVSWPWAWAWPEARPSADLVTETRYFRLGEGSFPHTNTPAGLGGWWPFLVMCLVVYGVLPRLLTLALAWSRLRAALRRTALHLPGSAEVLERLNTELVETRAETPDPAGPTAEPAADLAETGSLRGRTVAVIDWAQAAADRPATAAWLEATYGLQVSGWQAAGGSRSLAEDDAARTAALESSGDIVVLVKAWEPPMGELLDFLRALRTEAGEGRAVHVLPAAMTIGGAPAAASSRDLALWRRTLAGLGDPWLRLARPAGGDA